FEEREVEMSEGMKELLCVEPKKRKRDVGDERERKRRGKCSEPVGVSAVSIANAMPLPVSSSSSPAPPLPPPPSSSSSSSAPFSSNAASGTKCSPFMDPGGVVYKELIHGELLIKLLEHCKQVEVD